MTLQAIISMNKESIPDIDKIKISMSTSEDIAIIASRIHKAKAVTKLSICLV